jgi:tyrosinase
MNEYALILIDYATEPLFFLHHGQIDKLWTLWQLRDEAVRGRAFGGPKTQGSASTDATLEDIMPFLGLTADIEVEEIMSTRSALLCYEYV